MPFRENSGEGKQEAAAGPLGRLFGAERGGVLMERDFLGIGVRDLAAEDAGLLNTLPLSLFVVAASVVNERLRFCRWKNL